MQTSGVSPQQVTNNNLIHGLGETYPVQGSAHIWSAVVQNDSSLVNATSTLLLKSDQ